MRLPCCHLRSNKLLFRRAFVLPCLEKHGCKTESTLDVRRIYISGLLTFIAQIGYEIDKEKALFY